MTLQELAEHETAVKRMLALMDSYRGKLKDKDGKVIKNKDGKDANVYDVLIKDEKTGKFVIDPKVANFNIQGFRNKLAGVTKKTNQIKLGMDDAMLQRRWYGKLAMMFRKHVYPSIRKRWGSEYIDMEEGDWTAGYYNVFLKKIVQSFKQKSLEAFSAATEDEKRAIKKSMFEIATFIAVNMLVYGLSGLDDDDDPATANAELQLRRFSDDLGFYLVDVNAWMRIISSPAVSLNIVEKLQRAIGQAIINPTETYERKTGRYNVGDYKLQKNIDDLIPILSKMYNFTDPSDNLDFIKQRALF
jgi:hypothetical protein